MSEIKTAINRITMHVSSSPAKLFVDFEMFYGDAKLGATASRGEENQSEDIKAAMGQLINACEKELKKEVAKISG